jgi:hypothetical protein
MLMMYLSRKAIYMGSIYIKDRRDNIMFVLHDVPGLKTGRLDEEDLPFEIMNFAHEGWGVTIR